MSFDSRVQNMIDDILDRQTDYIEECKQYAKSGHRHHYCFHGVNMWVDYDCACWQCEDGGINEYSDLETITSYAKEVVTSQIEQEDRLALATEVANEEFNAFAQEVATKNGKDVEEYETLREHYVSSALRKGGFYSHNI